MDILIGDSPQSRRSLAGAIAPDCWSCVHFAITFDADFPRSCAVFGVKGRNLPSIDVFRATGHECPRYAKKEKR